MSARPCTEPGWCRTCGTVMYWAEWINTGKRVPIDALPVDNGNVVLTHQKAENKLIAERFDAAVHGADRRRYVSHFATCPQSKQHRRRA